MKTRNILYSVLALIMTAFTFTSCEDVPEPYQIPGTGGDDGNITITEPAGDGTLESPYNVLGIIQYIQDSETLTDKVYIKGKISQIKEIDASNFGNATFYISDDGSANNEFYVYRCMSLNNGKFQSADDIKVGDEVVIYGNVTIYNGTYETEANKAYIYSLNGETSTTVPDTPVTGTNLLTNGDFETWENGSPVNWQSASTASSATLTQSNDAHAGSYSVSIGFHETQNKRLAYKELTLKAGTYTYSFYAKSTTTDPSQCQAGYVPVTNGSAGSYIYLGYTTINNTSWTQVSGTFTLDATTTVCLVVMNPKTSSYATAQDILVDDASLVTNDGGIEGEESGTVPGEDPITPSTGDGSETSPYSVSNAINVYNQSSTQADVWVEGYIVGYIPSTGSTVLSNTVFNAEGAVYTNLVLAESPTETDYNKCIAVQLVSNSDPRKNLNLGDNPDKLGAHVSLYGNIEKYCSGPGLKSVSDYKIY